MLSICPRIYEKKEIMMAVQSRGLEGLHLKREPEPRPVQVVGGAPHGFGVWIDGEFHRVDIGALGTVIVKLTGELEAARKELAEQRQASNLYSNPEICRLSKQERN
jgi:hypothetical protein